MTLSSTPPGGLAAVPPDSLLTHLGFALALTALSLAMTWLMLTRVRIMDYPNERSAHRVPVPKSGGIAIVLTYVVGAVLFYYVGDGVALRRGYFFGLVLSTLTVAAVSFYDDVTSKPFTVKLASQLVAIGIVLASGVVVDQISLPWIGPVQLGYASYLVSFLWILGLTNAFNFMDGSDGLAAGVAAIASLFFLIVTFRGGSSFVYINSYAVLAGALGFLAFNFPRARIFMGDVGSATLGFVFATLGIIGARYDVSHASFMVMPLLLFTFIYDTAFTFARRLLNGENVTQAHRSHLYQLANRLGHSQRSIALFHYALCAVQGLLALWMVGVAGSQRVLVFLPVLAFHVAYSVVVVRAARRAGLLAAAAEPERVADYVADERPRAASAR